MVTGGSWVTVLRENQSSSLERQFIGNLGKEIIVKYRQRAWKRRIGKINNRPIVLKRLL